MVGERLNPGRVRLEEARVGFNRYSIPAKRELPFENEHFPKQQKTDWNKLKPAPRA
jgi:hypothetical protein